MSYLKFILIAIGIFSIFTIENSWGQESKSTNEEINIIGKIGEYFFNDPLSQIIKPFQEDGRGFLFLSFIIGLAGFSVFVWFFWRFISRRELIPSFHNEKESKTKFLAYVVLNVICFPIIIFVWFSFYSVLIFLLSEDLPFNLVMFSSMALIGAIRIVSYYNEAPAQEIGKTIPYAMLAMFLTSVMLFNDPDFLSSEKITGAIIEFQNNIPGVVNAIVVISIIESVLRGTLFVKQKFFPTISLKKLIKK